MTSRKQKLFINAYIASKFNATKAALKAGYSKKTAYSQGQRLLKNVEIQGKIEKRQAEILRELGVEEHAILTEFAKCAFINLSDLFDENGNLLPIKELPREVSAAIASIEVLRKKNEDGEYNDVVKIKLNDKLVALEKLGKNQGLFKEIFEGNIKTEGVIVMPAKLPVGEVFPKNNENKEDEKT